MLVLTGAGLKATQRIGELMGILPEAWLAPSDLVEHNRLRLTPPFLTGTEQECGVRIDLTRSPSRRRMRAVPRCRRLLLWRAQRPLDSRRFQRSPGLSSSPKT